MPGFLIHSMNIPAKESFHITLVGPPVCPLDTISNSMITPVRTRHIITTNGVPCKIKVESLIQKLGIFFQDSNSRGPNTGSSASELWTMHNCRGRTTLNPVLKSLRAEVAPVTHVFLRCRWVSLCTWNTKMVDEWMREQMSRGKRSPKTGCHSLRRQPWFGTN